MTHLSPTMLNDLAKNIKEWGRSLGFQQVGITDVDVSAHKAHFLSWIEKGYHGDMHFFERNIEKRLDPSQLHPGTCRVISVRMDYLPPDASFAKDLNNEQVGYISRYALGRDYHKVMRKKLKALGQQIEEVFDGTDFRPFVDSAPILEHAIAEKAGIGWTGKHSLTINKHAGSWFFLGELFINVPLPIDQSIEEGCGSCTACITICPTQAIVEPYVIDANKCISYLTIEHEGPIPEEYRRAMGNRIYGCDDCQLICPWNRYASVSQEIELHARAHLKSQPLTVLFDWDEAHFLKATEGTAIRRIGFAKWRRNLLVAMGNADYQQNIVDRLTLALGDSSAVLQEHAQWALDQQVMRRDKKAASLGAKNRLTTRLTRSIQKGLPRDA